MSLDDDGGLLEGGGGAREAEAVGREADDADLQRAAPAGVLFLHLHLAGTQPRPTSPPASTEQTDTHKVVGEGQAEHHHPLVCIFVQREGGRLID